MTGESHRISYLPSALADLEEISRYTAQKLGIDAADGLAARLIEGIDTLASFPYRRTVYVPLKPLSHEYRTLKIDQYLVFYWIEEETSTVMVSAVVYSRADIAHRMAKREQRDDQHEKADGRRP